MNAWEKVKSYSRWWKAWREGALKAFDGINLGDGRFQEMWVAIVHRPDGTEGVLCWNYMTQANDLNGEPQWVPQLVPILGRSRDEMDWHLSQIRPDMQAIGDAGGGGEDISLRCYDGFMHQEWWRHDGEIVA